MKAIKIKMKSGCLYSHDVIEIDEIFIADCSNPGFFKKSTLHDFLIKHPGTIYVDIYPYPKLIPATSRYGEKYVKSEPNNSSVDNLLNLPRY